MTYKIVLNNMIAISIIDSLPQEVLCITLKNINFEFTSFQDIFTEIEDYKKGMIQSGNHSQLPSSYEAKQSSELESSSTFVNSRERLDMRQMISLSVDSLVINNQLPNTQFPVILAPNKIKKSVNSPFLSINVYARSGSAKTVSSLSYITHFTFFVDTIEVRIDDMLIEALIMMYRQISFMTFHSEKTSQIDGLQAIYDFNRPFEIKIDEELERAPITNNRIYLKMLNVEPMEIIITFRNSPGHKMNIIASNFITDFGLVLASIDSARIKLNSLKSQHIFGSTDVIFKLISKHYTRQFWNQIYRLFGSFELLGDPISLINNLGTGIVDIFYEPLYSLATGKSTRHGHKFGKALAYGAVSFFSHLFTGIFDALKKISRSFIKALAALTADDDWLQNRQVVKTKTLKTVKAGFKHGGTFLLISFWEAFTGLFTRPYIMTKREGFGGFFRGVYQV